MKSRAFTLIELLVVIAIIGVLSAVVLASLSAARSKGNDAAVKANLKTILTQSYLYYDTNSGYGATLSTGTTTTTTAGSYCGPGPGTGLFGDTSVVNAMKAATNSAGLNANVNRMLCSIYTNGSFTFWEVLVPLASDPSKAWCVSSSGASKQVNTPAVTTGAPDC